MTAKSPVLASMMMSNNLRDLFAWASENQGSVQQLKIYTVDRGEIEGKVSHVAQDFAIVCHNHPDSVAEKSKWACRIVSLSTISSIDLIINP